MLTRRELGLALAGVGSLAAMPAAAQGWRAYTNPRFGTTIGYPDRFRPGQPPDNGGGLGFTAADGAVFSVWGSHNALEHDLKALEQFIREETTPAKRITYDARGANWNFLAGVHYANTFYERYHISHSGRI